MEAMRAVEFWQRAGVCYVRTEAMVKGFEIPLSMEFDGGDTDETLYILVTEKHMPVGTCRLHFLPEEGYAKIERVAVIEEARGKGAGRLAIEAAEEWIREMGYDRIVITSRETAVGFYEKCGYTADYSQTSGSGLFRLVVVEKQLEA
jgi:GNAT superfamily N-acetyltransferase